MVVRTVRKTIKPLLHFHGKPLFSETLKSRRRCRSCLFVRFLSSNTSKHYWFKGGLIIKDGFT